MELTSAQQVRFAKLIEAGEKPEAYLPFADPETDKNFMRAVKEDRVVTLNQDPASKRKDFGVVGFLKEKFATYLIFPKTLRAFAGNRVIGIDYSVLQSADVRIGGDISAIPKKPAPKKPKAAVQPPAIHRPPPEPEKVPKPEPKNTEKPKPQPKHFTVDLRLTTVDEKTIAVTAWNQREAEQKAIAEIQASSGFDKDRTTIQVRKVRSAD